MKIFTQYEPKSCHKNTKTLKNRPLKRIVTADKRRLTQIEKRKQRDSSYAMLLDKKL
ncbi:MAG: hypothetical protein PHE49_10820 [bacterium]|nr:hypothetical protein [bacterium]